jgi:hypothetical protein
MKPVAPNTKRNIIVIIIVLLIAYLIFNIITKGLASIPSDVWAIYTLDLIIAGILIRLIST